MKKELFINIISEKINTGKCELFVGSGISRPSNVPSWKTLLAPLADNIGIELDDEDDLPMIAQYIVNCNSGNKNCIFNRLEECFDKREPELNEYHYALSNIRVNRVWTTNYDLLLERCFSDRKPNPINCNTDLQKNKLNRRMEIIKIHGSIDGNWDDIVLTQNDYDEVLYKKTALTQKLEDSFINSSFLFLGYGYRDPDIRNLMIAAARKSESAHSLDHYIILTNITRKKNESKEEFAKRKRLFELWIKELNRIGIQELLIDTHEELLEILKEIALRSRGKSIFVSGSHEAEPSKEYSEYGKRLAKLDDVIMINGQNQGIGIRVVNGFMETAVELKKELEDIIKFYPNPYAANPNFANDKSLLGWLKHARESLFVNTQLFVVFAGGIGTRAEYEVAKDRNCLILPAIAEEKDYDNQLIKDILEDGYCTRILEKVPKYRKKLDAKVIPTIDDLLKATETLLNV